MARAPLARGLRVRCPHDTGWWLKDGDGGLVDWTIDGENWTVI